MASFRKLIKRGVLLSMPLVLVLLRLFFDCKYLSGKFFSNDLRGLIWCLRSLWSRHILRLAQPLPFPAALSVTVTNWRNLEFDPEDINNFQSPGCYFQCSHARIKLGKGVFIGPNTGLITANHDLEDLDHHLAGSDIEVGAKSWLGMNCVIMPGVHLGEGTVVAAGSVVTKSFPEGNCMIAGSPAVFKRSLNKGTTGGHLP